MNNSEIKNKIIKEMKVKPIIDVAEEIRTRIEFIKTTLKNSGLSSLVLGISGGIDSTTLGKLVQLAIDELNCESDTQTFLFFAVRLPYGIQADESDAQLALKFINPSVQLCVNIKQGVDALENESALSLKQALSRDGIQFNLSNDNYKSDFVKGNLKARARMLAQYQIAGLNNGLVLGTDHSAENITGFFTKWGDGACDLAPLFGLSKRQVKQIATFLDAPSELVEKAPTADLECLTPSKTDESVLGVSYDQLDDFLEGKSLDTQADTKIINLYLKTAHKRNPIPTIYDSH